MKQFSKRHRSISKRVKIEKRSRWSYLAATDPSTFSYKELWDLEKTSSVGSNSFQDSFLFQKFHSINLKLWYSAREIGKISAIFPWNYKQIRRVDGIIQWWFNLVDFVVTFIRPNLIFTTKAFKLYLLRWSQPKSWRPRLQYIWFWRSTWFEHDILWWVEHDILWWIVYDI